LQLECGFLLSHTDEPMTRKPAPKPDDPAQSQRFLDTAKEVGADRDEEALERAFKRIDLEKKKDSSKQR
jgi:hypothetical protein